MGFRASRARLRRSAIIAVLCLAVTAPSTGLALCRADDGCVTLELAHGGSRCETEEQRHHGSPVSFGSGCVAGEHDCSDLRIGTPVAASPKNAWRAMTPPPVAAQLAIPFVYTPKPSAIGGHAAMSQRDLASSGFLRAIRLLI